MMKAAVGDIVTVTGRSKVMVSAGPIPGRTPIAVPSAQPVSAQSRFIGCNATAKPCINASRTDIRSLRAGRSRRAGRRAW